MMSQRRMILLPRFCRARASDRACREQRRDGQPWFILSSGSRNSTSQRRPAQTCMSRSRSNQPHSNPEPQRQPSRSPALCTRTRAPSSQRLPTLVPRADVDRSGGRRGQQLRAYRCAAEMANRRRLQDAYPDALCNWRIALNLAEKLFPPNHVRLAEALENCASILRLLAQDALAAQYKTRARTIRQGRIARGCGQLVDSIAGAIG
jgi:hypothetical protein